MDHGEFLTLWSVRLAMALYVLALAMRALARNRPALWRGRRLAWTAGCLAFLIHTACAFGFYHHWSHAAAYEHTARRTAEVIGWSWGGGLYLNYLFAVLWPIDVACWWRNPSRHPGVEYAVQGFLAFIAFNATVVFAAGEVRWLGAAASLLLLLLWRLGRAPAIDNP